MSSRARASSSRTRKHRDMYHDQVSEHYTSNDPAYEYEEEEHRDDPHHYDPQPFVPSIPYEYQHYNRHVSRGDNPRHVLLSARSAGEKDPVSWIVPLVVTIAGTLIGGTGLAITTTALRVAATGLFYTATGGAALGTGYLAVEGGRLVFRKARSGLLGTIRTANDVARNIGINAIAGGRSVGITALAGSIVVGDQVVRLSRDAATQLATVLPELRGQIEAALTRNPLAAMISLPVQIQDGLLLDGPQQTQLDDDNEYVAVLSTANGDGLELVDMTAVNRARDGNRVVAADGDLGTSSDDSLNDHPQDGKAGAPPINATEALPNGHAPEGSGSGDIADAEMVMVELDPVAEMEDADSDWVSDAMSFRTARTIIS